MAKFRRQAQGIRKARNGQVTKKVVPDARSQIDRAPTGMLNDYLLKKRAAARIVPPRKKPDEHIQTLRRPDLQQRETRLLAAKSNKRPAADDDNLGLSSGRIPPKRVRIDNDRSTSQTASQSQYYSAGNDLAQREARLLAAKNKSFTLKNDSSPTPPNQALPTSIATTPSSDPRAGESPINRTGSSSSISNKDTPAKTTLLASTLAKRSGGLLSNARGIYSKDTVRTESPPTPKKSEHHGSISEEANGHTAETLEVKKQAQTIEKKPAPSGMRKKRPVNYFM